MELEMGPRTPEQPLTLNFSPGDVLHQLTLNSIGSWCLCHLPPKTLILSGAHKIHICFLHQDSQQPDGEKSHKATHVTSTGDSQVFCAFAFSL